MLILGCGYLGTALARQTLSAGGVAGALTRNPARVAELQALGVSSVVAADLASDNWHGRLNPADASIVNCVSPAAPGLRGYRHSFREGAQSIARWLENSAASGAPPARDLVFTSSTGVYPQTDGEWVDESAASEPSRLSEAGAVLRETEEFFLKLPRTLVRRVWILRLAGLYGPGRHYLLDALRAGEKSFSGGGEHWVNLLYLDDAVRAIQACLTAPPAIPGGIFNVADDEPVRKRDLVEWLAAQLGKSAFEIQFQAGASPRRAHRLGSTGKVPHRKISSEKFRKALGWVPVSHSYREGYGMIITRS